MPEDVSMKGGGIAACCCALLLSKAGYRVFADYPARSASPVLMLSQQTQKLLLDVFGGNDLFDGAVHISKRVVSWGLKEEQMTLPHSGLVISESTLLDRLWRCIKKMEGGRSSHQPVWSVVSASSALPAVSQHEFGSRIASTNSVELRVSAEGSSCWVESVGSGWLFLIPTGGNRGSLISVGSDPETLLAESRLVSDQIEALARPTGSFAAYPRVVTPLAGTGWIACGTAAVAFDPIAGEGAGNAIREAILASAVIRAIGKAGTENDLFAHYSNRILSGFLRHLQDCCRFYEAVPGPWWEAESQSLKRGVEWAQKEVNSTPKNLFRLLGFELHPFA